MSHVVRQQPHRCRGAPAATRWPRRLCGERLGAERPALARSLGRRATVPGRSNGLLASVMIH